MTKRAFLQTVCKGLYVHQSGSLRPVCLPLSCILLVGIRVGVNRTRRPMNRTSWARKSYQQFKTPGQRKMSWPRVLVSRLAGGSFSLDMISHWSFLLAFHFFNPSFNMFIFVSFLVSIVSTPKATWRITDVVWALWNRFVNFWSLTVIIVLVTGKYRCHLSLIK